jgi:hypothetical protein
MEDWQKEFWQTLDRLGEQLGEFLTDVTQEANEFVNTIGGLSEEMTLQLQETTLVIEQSVTEWLIPIVDTVLDWGGLLEETAAPMGQTIAPLMQQHPVCVGCQHYHGQTYGGTLLVCAMHPYGVEAGVNTCPDREETPWLSTHFSTHLNLPGHPNFDQPTPHSEPDDWLE